MKLSRPSLKEIVRPPEVSAFIDQGVLSSPHSGRPEDVSENQKEIVLALSVPEELYEALKVTMENRGLSLEEALREMLMDFLMKA